MRKQLRKIRRRINAILGKDFFMTPQITCDFVRHGSGYGGWDILEKEINDKAVVYSFGVGEDASFDISLIKKYGLIVHAFDPTPQSISWAKSQSLPNNFRLHEYGLADFDGDISFNPPDDPSHVSHTILDKQETNDRSIILPVKKMSTIMRELEHSTLDMLKMDIEGGEYQVIDDILTLDIRPKQILIEFHHRFPSVGIHKTKRAIKQLNGAGYKIFSVSDSGEEYSFVYVK
jgi:FkbM family methyltransferase